MYENHSVSYSNVSHYYNLHKNSRRKAWIIISLNLFFFFVFKKQSKYFTTSHKIEKIRPHP